MFIIGLLLNRLRKSRTTLVEHCEREIIWLDNIVKNKTQQGSGKGGKQRVGDCMTEDTPSFFLQTKAYHRVDDCEKYCGNGQQLKQTDIDCSNKVNRLVKQRPGHQPEQRP